MDKEVEAVHEEEEVARVEGPGIAGFTIRPGYDPDRPLSSPAGGYVDVRRFEGVLLLADFLVVYESLGEIAKLKERAKKLSVEGHRQYNPGWHLALDLTNMLVVSECIAKAALEREESRGGHTRDDFPGPDDRWGALNLVLTLPPGSDEVDLRHQPLPAMPEDLKKLFDQ